MPVPCAPVLLLAACGGGGGGGATAGGTGAPTGTGVLITSTNAKAVAADAMENGTSTDAAQGSAALLLGLQVDSAGASASPALLGTATRALLRLAAWSRPWTAA